MRRLSLAMLGLLLAAPALAQDQVQRVTVPQDDPRVERWQQQLDEQVLKLIDAGHMAPWRVQPGETESYFYFTDPFELVLILSRAAPYMSPEVAEKAEAYLEQELQTYPPGLVSLLPYDEGTFREIYDLPAEDRTFRYRRWLWRSLNTRPRMMAFYALWNYAEAFDRWDTIERMYPQLVVLFDEQLTGRTNLLEEAVGLIGFARIAEHMGDAARTRRARSAAQHLISQAQQSSYEELDRRARDRYDADTRNQGGQPLTRPTQPALFHLVPETVRLLTDEQKQAAVRAAEGVIGRYPLWYIPLPPHGDPLFGENTSIAPDIKENVFLIKAMVEEAPTDELASYLDLPWLPVGDLYFIESLMALIESAGEGSWQDYAPGAPEQPRFDEQAVQWLRDDLQAARTAPWKISKTFPAPAGTLATPQPPEQGALPGTDAGAEMEWRDVRMSDAEVNLKETFEGDPTNAVVYAWTRVWAPQGTEAVLRLRNDDAMAAWVNGNEVFRDTEGLGWMPGYSRAPVRLREGWNTILLKVAQGEGNWTFGARLEEPGGAPLTGLKFATE